MPVYSLSRLSRAFLAVCMFASLFFGGGALPAASAPQTDSPAALAVSQLAPAAPSVSVLDIPEKPAGSGSPVVDGVCGGKEYSSGAAFTFVDGPAGGNATLYLIHDSINLYACISAPAGGYALRFFSLYLDPQANGSTYTFAQQDDFALKLPIPGQQNSGTGMRGSGVANGYVADPAIDATWWTEQATTVQGQNDSGEYSLNLEKFKLNACNIFGLASYHHWFNAGGNDYGWPSNKWFDQPGTWQLMRLTGLVGNLNCSGTAGSIAYVFSGNTADAMSFYALLTAAGYSVTLVPLSDVLLPATDFNAFDMVIIADDSGSLNDWGTPTLTTSQVDKIIAPNKPILGVGEGGYAFFGRLSLYIGWPRGWHGPQQKILQDPADTTSIWSGVTSPALSYTNPTNSVGIYLKPAPLPTDVVSVALETPLDDHANLITQDCRTLWGSGGNPSFMTGDGQKLFLNSVLYTLKFQCPKRTPPSDTCYTISKSANPPVTSTIPLGGIIEYTLQYWLKTTLGCPATGKVVDMIPFGTDFVPGSAVPAAVPAGGVLTWSVGSSAAAQTVSFKVRVTDAVCAANKKVANFGELRPSAAAPLASNTVVHDIACPPIGLPNTQPVFAEDELQVSPYPMVAGTPTLLSVRVTNLDPAVSHPVTVQFQTSPAKFGIGLAYTTVASTSAALPGGGAAVLSASFIPDSSGNQCVQAVVSTPGAAPLITQRCLDVTEVFTIGQPLPDHLTVPVRNNTASLAPLVTQVVDNTCPGWSAVVNPPTLTNLAAGATQNVDLAVTPPTSGVLGTGCHIDLQAWIGDTLIGGIRKLDVPPVHLPFDVRPAWEEPEITFVPDPPQVGLAGQICIQLINPLAVSKTVSVDFSVADFGAGIGFAPATSLVDLVLPPNSIGTYCAPWTPAASGTLHRCVLATLKQVGYQDQHSQRNIDVVRPATRDLSGLVIPFVVGNRDLGAHALTLQGILIGLNQWTPVFETPGLPPGPPPASIPGGGQAALQMRFVPAAGQTSLEPGLTAPILPDFYFGSRSSVEVTVLLDGIPVSGFSVKLEVNRVYIPVIKK